jgi:arylsulfatase A
MKILKENVNLFNLLIFRRHYKKRLKFIIGVYCFLGILILMNNCSPSETASNPNIILIMADDLGYNDVSIYREMYPIDYDKPPTSQTPAIDRLAEEGMLFKDFYSGSPVCSPSRGALLTGRNSTRIGIYNWIPPESPMHLRSEEVTLAEQLKGVGYNTAHFGKWHLTSQGMGQPLPNDQGYDYSFYTYNNASPSFRNPDNYYRNGAAVGKLEGYASDLVVTEAIEWLDRKEHESPFYINIWFNEPHNSGINYSPPFASPEELVNRHEENAVYYAAIENMDMAVGKLIEYLKVNNLEDNTILIFTSDNGSQWPNSNRPLYGAKHFTYEGGIRIPFIIKWPGIIEKGSVTNAVGSFTDIFPTFSELTGAEVSHNRIIDGESLLQVYEDHTTQLERNKPIFHYRYFHDPILMLREGNWVLLGYDELVPRSDNLQPQELDKIEPWRFEKNHMEFLLDLEPNHFKLYNLDVDLGQENDLADDYPEKLREMKQTMLRLKHEMIEEGGNWYEKNSH